MPLYEFRCLDCGRHFEALTSLGRERDVRCEACGSASLRKCVSGFGIGGGSRRIKSGASCSSCASGSCTTCR